MLEKNVMCLIKKKDIFKFDILYCWIKEEIKNWINDYWYWAQAKSQLWGWKLDLNKPFIKHASVVLFVNLTDLLKVYLNKHCLLKYDFIS